MKISARVLNSEGNHQVILRTNDNTHTISIPSRASGFGSSANGGELLFLALATCYCNDIYREAGKMGIKVESVEVEVEGDFEAEGTPARNVAYRAKVAAHASQEEIEALMMFTDQVAEIQNSLRGETPVVFSHIEATPI